MSTHRAEASAPVEHSTHTFMPSLFGLSSGAEAGARWVLTALASGAMAAGGRMLQRYLARRAEQRLMARQINPEDPQNPHEKTLRETVCETKLLVEMNQELREQQHLANEKRFDLLETTLADHSDDLRQMREEMARVRQETALLSQKQEARDERLRKEYRAGLRGLRQFIAEQIANPNQEKQKQYVES